MGKCGDLLDVMVESVVLGFDLLPFGDPMALTPPNLGRALRAKKVQEEMNKSLSIEAARLMAKHYSGAKLTEHEARSFLGTTGSVLADRVTSDLSDTLTCQLKESPLGVWVDRNKWVLYVVVPVIVAGGAYGAKLMYDARIGDEAASWATKLAGKHLSFRPVGSLRLGAKEPVFEPSKREASVKLFVTKNWDRVEATLTLGGGIKEGEISKGSAEWGMSLPLGLRYKGVAGASTLDLNIKGFLQTEAGGGNAYGGAASVKLKTDLGQLPATIGATSKWENRSSGEKPGPEYSITLGLELASF